MSRSSVALSNLRAVVILIVLAFHAVLPYLASLPASPYRFDDPPYRWRAFPVVDNGRWFGFDLFCAWQDVSLMALMFLVSGLFVASSLQRKGTRTFLFDRLIRIGLPFAVAAAMLMPIAYYPAYAATAVDPSFSAYWQHWIALPFWPCGPQWFLWLLLVFNIVVVAFDWLVPRGIGWLGGLVAKADRSSVRFFAVLAGLSALAYVPLAVAYTPWNWADYGPLSFQISRPLHYLIYFVAGVALGARGIDRGLLAIDGSLVRHWAAWLIAALVGFVLWALPTSQTLDPTAEVATVLQIAAALGYVVACASGCLCLVALCLRFLHERRPAFDILSANAYGLYLVHYGFAVWLQYALLNAPLFAVVKGALVFCGTLGLSLAVTMAWGRVSAGAQAVPAKREPRRA
jgi:hypothetical protein